MPLLPSPPSWLPLGALLLVPQDGIDPAEAARAFAEAHALSAADGGALWGVELDGPLLFVDPASRTMAANRPDPGGVLVELDGVFAGDLPPEVAVANTAQAWSGARWTTVVWPLPADPVLRRKLLAHELFHRVQPQVPLSTGASPENAHLDGQAGRTWLRLEWRALAAALTRTGEAGDAALGDALAFRAHRHALFPGSRESEALLERNEGLAEYTGWRCCGLPASELPARAAARLRGEEQGDHFTRGFAYASGPALALLLDQRVGDGWRREVFDDLGLRLAQALGTRAADDAAPTEDELLLRAVPYGVEEVLAEEEAREERRLEREARYRARFLEGPVLELPLTPAVSYSFDPTAVEVLEGHGQVHRTLVLTDAWGRLDVRSGGALLLRDAGRLRAVRVPAPASLPEPPEPLGDHDGPWQGDGYVLELASGWRLERVDGGSVVTAVRRP